MTTINVIILKLFSYIITYIKMNYNIDVDFVFIYNDLKVYKIDLLQKECLYN